MRCVSFSSSSPSTGLSRPPEADGLSQRGRASDEPPSLPPSPPRRRPARPSPTFLTSRPRRASPRAPCARSSASSTRSTPTRARARSTSRPASTSSSTRSRAGPPSRTPSVSRGLRTRSCARPTKVRSRRSDPLTLPPRASLPLERSLTLSHHTGRNPVADIFSEWALRQTIINLPRVARDGNDREAKASMLWVPPLPLLLSPSSSTSSARASVRARALADVLDPPLAASHRPLPASAS